MSTERPNIIQVKDNVVQVTLPYIEGTKDTYLTAAPAAGATSLTVKDNSDFSQNDYVMVGTPGNQQSEIVRITAVVTAGTALTTTALTFSHGNGAKITLLRYNQVGIYGSSSASDAAPTLIGSVTGIDVKRGYNEIVASTTYAYYYARFYNVQTTTYSSYSDSAAAGGLSSLARGEIKREFLSIYNETIDDLISDDWLNRSINRWQRDLLKRRKQWSFLRAISRTDTVQDQQNYTLPSDIFDTQDPDSIVSVKYKDQVELTYIDQRAFLLMTSAYIGTTLAAAVAVIDTSITLTDSSDFAAPTSGTATINIQGDAITYTTNTKATGVLSGVTGITAIHSSGDECWQTYTTGQPMYYTIDSGKLKVYPIPSSAYAGNNLTIEYWKKFVDLADDQDETLFTKVNNIYLYLHWQSAVRRKLPLQEQIARKREFQEDLESIVADDGDFRDVLLQPQDLYRNPY